MSAFDRSAELPATDEYMSLLAEAQGPEDVAALIQMHAADVAGREALIDAAEANGPAERPIIMPDGTIATRGLLETISEQEPYNGCYRNGSRA